MVTAFEGELVLALPVVTGQIIHRFLHRARRLCRIHTGALTGNQPSNPQDRKSVV